MLQQVLCHTFSRQQASPLLVLPSPPQIAVGVSLGRLRPQPPPTTQAPLANLIFCCCDLDPGARPRFAEVADKLSEILDQIRPQDEVRPA